AVGSIGGGDRRVIAYITDLGFLHILDEMGEEPYPFPLDLGRDRRWSGVAAADLDNDGNSEFIFTHYAQHRDSLGLTAVIGVINSRGEYRQGFPVIIPNAFISSPAVGDITGDGNLEIVVAFARRDSALCSITAYTGGGEELNGFPREMFSTIGSSISLADKDGDGRCEIYFWGRDVQRGQGGIWGLTSTGEVLENFPLLTRKGHPWGGVAIADLEGDGSWEFAFGTYDPERGSQVYLWRENGAPIRGFPVTLESPSVVGSLVMEDVSGDGILDIVVASSPNDEIPSRIFAFNHRGETVEGFPLSLDDWGGWAMGGTPTLYDLNRDGNTDILAITAEGTLFAWATGGRFTGRGWLTEKGFFNRSGYRGVRQGLLRAETPMPTLPKNTFLFYPQPFNGTGILNIRLSHSQEVNIKLYDLQGRERVSLYQGYLATGTHNIPINLALSTQSSGI
ncbi:MAG: FG-GAP-like repeat-containing protein, partial [bacterium]